MRGVRQICLVKKLKISCAVTEIICHILLTAIRPRMSQTRSAKPLRTNPPSWRPALSRLAARDICTTCGAQNRHANRENHRLSSVLPAFSATRKRLISPTDPANANRSPYRISTHILAIRFVSASRVTYRALDSREIGPANRLIP